MLFTPDSGREVLVKVNDLYGGGGGPRDYFLLRVLLQEPDYDLTVANDRFIVTPGKPTTIAVKVNRRFGFDKPVEVLGVRLPEHVKVEMTTPAKPDPNTITLTVTAEKPWSGPFYLVGHGIGIPKSLRPVRAPLAEFDETTAELWLTVTAPAKK